MTGLDGLEEVVCRIVDAGDNVSISFGVSSPKHDDLVKGIVGFEVPSSKLVRVHLISRQFVPNVFSQLLDMIP